MAEHVKRLITPAAGRDWITVSDAPAAWLTRLEVGRGYADLDEYDLRYLVLALARHADAALRRRLAGNLAELADQAEAREAGRRSASPVAAWVASCASSGAGLPGGGETAP